MRKTAGKLIVTCLAPRTSLSPVDYLYSLYDALVSIHVPNDKARGVVDAMERDMGLLSSRMLVQLGSMLVVGFGVMIAALKFLLS